MKLLCDEYFALSFATFSTPKTQTKEGIPKKKYQKEYQKDLARTGTISKR